MRYFLLGLLLSLNLSAFATEVLVVEQTTGQTSWPISNIKELTFDGNGVKISFNDNNSAYYAKETLSMIKFNGFASGINTLNDTSKSIKLEGDFIVTGGINCGIKVFSLSGSLVAQGEGNILNISGLSGGTYIVQAGNITSKIFKQ